MRVLLVEDDIYYVVVVQGYLRRIAAEVTVHHATSLAAATALVTSEHFDVALLDLNLPDTHGTDTVVAMSAAAPHLPLVALTGESTVGIDLQALEAGAQEYLAKDELSVVSLRRAIRYAQERHRLTRSLAQANQLNRLMLDHLPVSIELLDAEGRVQFINPVGLASLSLTDAGKVVGRPWLQLWMPPAEPALKALLDQARTGQNATLEGFWARIGAVPRWWSLVILPLPLGNALSPCYLVVSQDLTERRFHEKHLHQAQQAELLERIAAGVAHNFNNLLTVVQGCSEMMLRTLPESDARQRRRAKDIRQAAIRGRQLVEHLLAYSHHAEPSPMVIDLNAFLEQEAKLLEGILKPFVSFDLELLPEPIQLQVDPWLLSSALLIFILNANEVMPEGGTVTLSACTVALDTTFLSQPTCDRLVGDAKSVLLAGSPVKLVKISVRDTGPGMNPTTLANIFTPFFTTKPVDKGSGLGLVTAAAQVEKMGGFIGVTSRPGAGAQFDVYLPLHPIQPTS
ncbi:MAG: response regulator [Acidobacteriota bacterium]